MKKQDTGNGSSSIVSILKNAKKAFLRISCLNTEQKNKALAVFAGLMDRNRQQLLEANAKDLEEHKGKISEALYQRLSLSSSKIDGLVQGTKDVVKLADPANSVVSVTELDDGMELSKVSVPLGVIGVIFESRPDVVPQVLSLILKSGNAVILKGGRESGNSCEAFMGLVRQLNAECPFLPEGWATLITSREEVHEILKYPEYVDLIIPRGSNSLVRNIMDNTRIPVMGHADGVCHIYVHGSADLQKAMDIIVDSKTQYPAACNAVEMLLVDSSLKSGGFLEKLTARLESAGVSVHFPKKEDEYHKEFGELAVNIKIVNNEDEAIDHINVYGSHHTDSILAQDNSVAQKFFRMVDSANVFQNCSTRFSDGFRYGFGAEIGISTSKLHARGPVGLEGLVSYKYVLKGSGQVVADYVGSKARSFTHKKLR